MNLYQLADNPLVLHEVRTRSKNTAELKAVTDRGVVKWSLIAGALFSITPHHLTLCRAVPLLRQMVQVFDFDKNLWVHGCRKHERGRAVSLLRQHLSCHDDLCISRHSSVVPLARVL
jgi:hypothetical protein